MPCGATQDGRVMVERSDRMWSTGEGNGKPLQYSCLENPINSMNSVYIYICIHTYVYMYKYRYSIHIFIYLYTYILEKVMAAHFSIFCLENTTNRGAWWATVHAVAESWTRLSNWTHIHIFICAYKKLAFLVAQWWRIHLLCRRCGFCPWIEKISWSRKWQPTPVLLPGKSHRQKSLEGYSPWDCKELDMTYQVSNNII